MLDKFHDFKVIIDTGNLTEAAKKLHVSQPALSISVKKLEKQLGCKLLIRNKGGVKPTQFGKILYKYARRFNLSVGNMKKELSDQLYTLEKDIKIGMIDNVGIKFIGRVYKGFRKKYPKLNLTIQVDNSTRLVREVEKGSIDFAIITKQKRLKNNFIQEDFASEDLIIISASDYVQEATCLKDLEKINFIAYNKDSTTFKLIDKAFTQNKININYSAYSTSPTFIKEMVKLGTGIAVLPKNIVDKELASKKLRKIDLGIKLSRQLSLIYLKNAYLTNLDKNFIEKLRNMF